MHGLIFETSIWLLAGSTRFLRSNLQNLHSEDWKLHTNLHSICVASCITWAHRILLSSHFSSNHSYNMWNTHRKPKLPDQAPSGLTLNAFGCETRNSSKVQIQILKHCATPKSCRLEKLYPSTRTCCFNRETNNNAKLKNLFNAKTYTSKLNSFRCFILLPLHEEY